MWPLLAILALLLIASFWLRYSSPDTIGIHQAAPPAAHAPADQPAPVLRHTPGMNIRTAYLLIGIAVLSTAAAIIVLTALGRVPALSGYSGGASLVLGGTALMVAWRKNYRAHWSFVTAVSLLTFGLAAVGGEIDEYCLRRSTASDLAFGLTLSAIFLTFGALTLWSSQKLHLRTIEAELNRSSIN